MSRVNQGPDHHFVSVAYEKHDDGHCGSRCTSQVWHVTFQRLDQEIRWIITKQSVPCYCPSFGSESKRIYREAQLAYIINDEKNPTNHPIYAIDTDFGACILQIEESQLAST